MFVTCIPTRNGNFTVKEITSAGAGGTVLKRTIGSITNGVFSPARSVKMSTTKLESVRKLLAAGSRVRGGGGTVVNLGA